MDEKTEKVALDMLGRGIAIPEIASSLGVRKIAVMRLALDLGAGNLGTWKAQPRERSPKAVNQTDVRIGEMLRSGMRPKEIAFALGVSRQRVSQRIRRANLSIPPRPTRVRMSRKYGIPIEEANRLRSIGATAAFTRQKQNARTRGIEWDLTFKEWWAIWEESGRWEQRGRDRGGWVMGRYADEGPYAVGNVYICSHSENATVRSSPDVRALQKRWKTSIDVRV